jgi:nicotinate-nucleotide pyrophosphorylase (carboxylating)
MNWSSRRITAILSNALLEDQANRDATTLATIDPQQKALATILAKEDCVLAGIASVQRIFEVFAELEGESRAYPEVSIPQEILMVCVCAKARPSLRSATTHAYC